MQPRETARATQGEATDPTSHAEDTPTYVKELGERATTGPGREEAAPGATKREGESRERERQVSDPPLVPWPPRM